ncbi:hypothetical protein BH11BAC2_BH11BAC2_21100 [soil metagenome]
MKKLCIFVLLFLTFFYADAQINVFNSVNLPTGYNGSNSRYNRDFIVDHLGRQWIALRDSGVGMYDGNTWTFFSKLNSALQNDTVYSLSEDIFNNIWMGSKEGLVKFDGTNWTLYNKANNQLPSDTITCAAHKNGDSWFGTAKGLVFYDGISWTQYTTSNSNLPNDSIQCIGITSNGYVWIGTISGVYGFDGLSFTPYYATANSPALYDIRTLLITVNEAVWISSPGGSYYLNNSGEFNSLDSLLNDSLGPCNVSIINHSGCLFGEDSLGNIYFTSTNTAITNLYKITPQLSVFLTINLNAYINKCYQFRVHNNTLYTSSLNYRYSCFGGFPYFPGFKFIPLDSIDFHTPLFFANNLYINHVNARIQNRGDMHWDPVIQTPMYYVPDCSYKQTVYASAIWIGGLDQTSKLHTSAMLYRQAGAVDFFPGPLDTISGQADSISMRNYDRLWKINKSTIDEFKINFQNGNVGNGTYPIPESIATWPGAGSGNHSRRLAPYIDYNGDGAYNPNDGDYPQIRGDQELWWVFNDTLSPHTETNGPAFGLEIHGEAYAYNCPLTTSQTDVINYTTFYRYTLINRSSNTYDSIKVGLWCDFDLGNASDDNIGCDTMQNTFFAYNGDNNDDGAGGFGLNPPMLSVTVLKGPSAYTNDGLDNNHNGLTDENNETHGMSDFVFYQSSNNPYTSNPFLTIDYNYYLNSTWFNGAKITYGGDGFGNGIGATNIPTNYMYSGTPYDNSGWTMATGGIQPTDVRGIGSSGPFHLAPGESQTIDFAYIYTRDTTGPNGLYTSVAKNHDDVRRIREWFDAGSPDPCLFLSIKENNTGQKFNCTLSPNPSDDRIYIDCSQPQEKINYIIHDLLGRTITSGVYSKSGIDISKLSPQLYLIEFTGENNYQTLKFIKRDK